LAKRCNLCTWMCPHVHDYAHAHNALMHRSVRLSDSSRELVFRMRDFTLVLRPNTLFQDNGTREPENWGSLWSSSIMPAHRTLIDIPSATFAFAKSCERATAAPLRRPNYRQRRLKWRLKPFSSPSHCGDPSPPLLLSPHRSEATRPRRLGTRYWRNCRDVAKRPTSFDRRLSKSTAGKSILSNSDSRKGCVLYACARVRMWRVHICDSCNTC